MGALIVFLVDQQVVIGGKGLQLGAFFGAVQNILAGEMTVLLASRAPAIKN